MKKPAIVQLRIRVPAARTRKARVILNDLGTDIGTLVNMLLVQVIKQRAIPFRIADTDFETDEIRQGKPARSKPAGSKPEACKILAGG